MAKVTLVKVAPLTLTNFTTRKIGKENTLKQQQQQQEQQNNS